MGKKSCVPGEKRMLWTMGYDVIQERPPQKMGPNATEFDSLMPFGLFYIKSSLTVDGEGGIPPSTPCRSED